MLTYPTYKIPSTQPVIDTLRFISLYDSQDYKFSIPQIIKNGTGSVGEVGTRQIYSYKFDNTIAEVDRQDTIFNDPFGNINNLFRETKLQSSGPLTCNTYACYYIEHTLFSLLETLPDNIQLFIKNDAVPATRSDYNSIKSFYNQISKVELQNTYTSWTFAGGVMGHPSSPIPSQVESILSQSYTFYGGEIPRTQILNNYIYTPCLEVAVSSQGVNEMGTYTSFYVNMYSSYGITTKLYDSRYFGAMNYQYANFNKELQGNGITIGIKLTGAEDEDINFSNTLFLRFFAPSPSSSSVKNIMNNLYVACFNTVEECVSSPFDRKSEFDITIEGGQTNNNSTVKPEDPSVDNTYLDAGFVSMYAPTTQQIMELKNWLWSGDFADTVKKLFSNPMDAVVSLQQVFVPTPTSSNVSCKIGNVDSGISMAKITDNYINISCGSVDIPLYWNNYSDFTDTDIMIYLCGVGFKQLNPSDVMGGKITVTYGIDLLSGTSVCKIHVDREANELFNNAIHGVLYEYNAITNIDLPISATDYTNKLRNMTQAIVTAGTGTISSIASGNPIPFVMGTISAAQSMVNNYVPVQRAGAVGSSSFMFQSRKPYVIISRPTLAYPSNYGHLVGYPSNINSTGATLSGFTQYANIHLENVIAYEEEKNELESLMKEGIIY